MPDYRRDFCDSPRSEGAGDSTADPCRCRRKGQAADAAAGLERAGRNSPALLLWLYDASANRYAARVSKTLTEMGDGEYHILDLGLQSLNPSISFYFFLAGNAGVEAVYIDRVMLIREKGAVTQ